MAPSSQAHTQHELDGNSSQEKDKEAREGQLRGNNDNSRLRILLEPKSEVEDQESSECRGSDERAATREISRGL